MGALTARTVARRRRKHDRARSPGGHRPVLRAVVAAARSVHQSVPRAIARLLSDDLKRMLGYSIFPLWIGAVDGVHPLRLLDD